MLLLVAYGTAVTEHDPGEPLLRGMALLVLVGAWLWLPRLGPREALAGAALVLALGALSLPVAAALDGAAALVDYRAWDWFGSGKAVTFDWTHRYGPLDWPRDGTTLLNVKSTQPHYWKAEVLDTFDGLRWVRGRDERRGAGCRTAQPCLGRRPLELLRVEPQVGPGAALHGSLAVDRACSCVAGTPYGVQGAGLVSTAADGTTHLAAPLKQGDSYTVSTYVPDPTRGARCAGRPGASRAR